VLVIVSWESDEKMEEVGEDGRESGKLKERVKVELEGGVACREVG